MAITKTRLVVNAVNMIKDGWTDSSGVFIDRLKDGRRSLKVWGWTSDEYIRAVHLLKQMGCTHVQGYLYSKALSPEGLKNLL